MTNTIYGGVSQHGDGMSYAAQAMALQMSRFQVHADNITHFGIPGYQKKTPMVREFADYLGTSGVESVTSTVVGRLRRSGQPLDVALNTQGYFQRLNPASGTVELSRDGRMRIDAEGNLLSLDDKPILNTGGQAIQLPWIPQTPEKELEISENGTITLYNPKNGEITPVGQLGVVSPDGTAAEEPQVVQGYVEDSNVFLQEEYVSLMPIRRQFEATRQTFIIQSDALSRMVQELGRAQ